MIPTRNRAARLEAALASLRRQTLSGERFEVIVIDDGSTDETPELLEREARDGGLALHSIRHTVSLGSGASRNEGWRAGRADLIAFMDDDCEAEPGWLEAGLAAWGGDPRRFLQGPTAPIPDEEHRLGPFSYSVNVRQLDTHFQTCNMFYPRPLLEAVEGFDAEAFPYPQGEDTDLAYRAKGAGGVPAWAADACMRHAVLDLGPLGFLRRAWSWGNAMEVCVRHPDFKRRRLVYKVFWNPSHYELARLILAILLPRRRFLWPLRLWLARPYLTWRLGHPRDGRYAPWLLPWYVVVDLVEMAGVLRGSLRHGTFVL